MSKRTPFLFFIILILSTMPLPRAEALGIGPPSFELDLRIDGSNSTTVYLLSDGLEGELIIGLESLPFRVEPSKINMSKEDHYRPVEITFYGNETLESGVYEGIVTFIAYTGGFVAVGIKIRAKINLLETSPELHHEEEPDLPDIDDLKDWAEGKQETSEEEPETIEEAQVSKNSSFIFGGLAIGIAVVLGLIGIWWKRR